MATAAWGEREKVAGSSSSEILDYCSLLPAFNLKAGANVGELLWLLAGNTKYTKRKCISCAHHHCGSSVLPIFHSYCDEHCVAQLTKPVPHGLKRVECLF